MVKEVRVSSVNTLLDFQFWKCVKNILFLFINVILPWFLK